MSNLIKLELRTLFKQKLFYICAGLLFLMYVPLSFLGDGKHEKAMPHIMDFLGSELGFVTIVFITIFALYDFSEGTVKNIIARGYTRRSLFLSKYITSVIAVVLLDLVVAIIMFLAFIKNGIGFESNMIYGLIGYLFVVISMAAVYVSIAFMVQKTSIAIIINIFIPIFMPAALIFADAKLKFNISDYWMGEIYSIATKKGADIGNICHSGLLAIAYMVVFIVLALIVINKEK